VHESRHGCGLPANVEFFEDGVKHLEVVILEHKWYVLNEAKGAAKIFVVNH
jgi:hypothetical protein